MSFYPRLMIAGTHSGVGKTVIATALMAALTEAGFSVQPFKVGPDYIDPGYHNAATGCISRNLDSWLVGLEKIKGLFTRAAAEADLSIVEGVMGLYDGLGASGEGSSAQIAHELEMPVLLIVDARSMARSAAALVLGYQKFDPCLNLKGVILNRVGSPRHAFLLKEAVESNCGLPVLGWIPRQDELGLPERHLGLVPTAEKANLSTIIKGLAGVIAENIDMEKIVDLARKVEPLSLLKSTQNKTNGSEIYPLKPLLDKVKIGIARDEAFNFYYQDGLNMLTTLGAELVYCSPLNDRRLPSDLDGLYLGGGFPEMFLAQLSGNVDFRKDLKEAVQDGLPLYAECGGLMYLSKSVIDFAGDEYSMVGLLPGRCKMEQHRVGLGYVTATALKDSILAAAGAVFRGHEFHYSSFKSEDEIPWAYCLNRAGDFERRMDGYAGTNFLASYLHLHFAGCIPAAHRFLKSCLAYRCRRWSV